MKKLLFILVSTLSICKFYGQTTNCPELRLYDIFGNVSYAPNSPVLNVNTGLFFTTAQVTTTHISPKADIYVPKLNPADPSNKKFPLAIICHGTATRKHGALQQSLALNLAQRGFVAVCLDYRLDADGNAGLYDFYNNNTAGFNKTLQTRVNERISYSNAMDVTNLITFMINNHATYRVDTNTIIIGGHSLGGLTTTTMLYIDRDEVQTIFPTTFYSDTRYINIERYQNKLKFGFLLDGAITNLNYIDNDENTPLFAIHGTHDYLCPMYIGEPLCSSYLPRLYGGAAITEKLDSFNDSLGFSYYFIQLNGIGHQPFLSCVDNDSLFFNQLFVYNLWQGDFIRYLYNSINFTAYKNQIYKKVTPINEVYNYCIEECIENNSYNKTRLAFVNTGPIWDIMRVLKTSCFPVPNLNLSVKPWNDIAASYSGCVSPPINWNTSSTQNCIINIDNYTQANFMRKSNINTPLQSQLGSIAVYPNPVIGNEFYFEINTMDDEEEATSAYLIDINGRIYSLLLEKASKNKCSLSKVGTPSGSYILVVETNKTSYTLPIEIMN